MRHHLLCVLLSLALPTWSQNIGARLYGTVRDAQQLPVQGAQVAVRNTSTGKTVTLVTDGQGRWQAAGLSPGQYAVHISKPGFSLAELNDLELTIGQVRGVDIVLQPAARTESITVTGRAVEIHETSGQQTSSYSRRLMNELPMLAGGVGRNFRTQVYLTPGVAPSTTAHRPFAVAGSRTRNNNYMIDSNDFNEIEGGLLMGRGASEQLLSTEAIEGMQVLTHNFKAEFGRQSGSIISIVTKQGSNDWHGLAFEYLRNDRLDARNALSPIKPKLRSHQFGFNLGGPVLKNRTFFFVNNEWFPRRQGNLVTIQTLTPAQRTRVEPAVRALVAQYPLPNSEPNLYRSQAPFTGDQWSGVARLDHVISASQHVFWRFTRLDSTNRGSAGAGLQRYETNVVPQAHSVQHAWTPWATTLNELRLNYTRFLLMDRFIDPIALGDPTLNGLVGSVQVNGLSPLGHFSFMPRRSAQNTYQISDDLSGLHGNHSWKAGAVLRRLHFNNGVLGPSFTGILRFNSIADFLAARPAAYSRNVGDPYLGLRASEFGVYWQDDWKPFSRLTLNLGLRYEYNTVPYEVNNKIPQAFRYRPDRNNFAPRFGFALGLDRSTTVLRGGYGIYYNVLELSFVGLTRFNPPLIHNYAAANPQFPDLLANASQSIPSGLVIPDPNLRQPYAQHVNLTLERRLGTEGSVSVAYVGTLGRKLPRTARPNGGEGLAQRLRPDPSLGVVNRLESAASSTYHSLQSSWNNHWHNLLTRFSYTYSKSLDDISDFASTNTGIDRGLLALDERNWRLNRGRSDFDLPHVLTLAWAWQLPRLSGTVLGRGWSIQGIMTAQSGRVFTLYSGTDNLQGNNTNRILDIPGSLLRLDRAGSAPLAISQGFSKAMLTPAPGSLGTIGRNTERGGRLFSFNTSLFRSFTLAEGRQLQIRAESFNLLNHVNYELPDGILSSPTFGRVLAALDPRQVQFGVRLIF